MESGSVEYSWIADVLYDSDLSLQATSSWHTKMMKIQTLQGHQAGQRSLTLDEKSVCTSDGNSHSSMLSVVTDSGTSPTGCYRTDARFFSLLRAIFYQVHHLPVNIYCNTNRKHGQQEVICDNKYSYTNQIKNISADLH